MKKQYQVNSENILPIIKQWLYSDKDIFLRELVSNATDALTKLEHLQTEAKDLRVDITLDEKNGEVTIADNGIGMTAEEVEKYICQVAFSGAKEFLDTYKDDEKKNNVIGHFGLGFYSAFMVSNLVTIETLSHKEDAKPVLWTSTGDADYTIEEGSKKERGTTIMLKVADDSNEFLKKDILKNTLVKYCRFFPFAIYFNEEHINKEQPLWMKSPKECTDKEYIDFYHSLYPMEAEPSFWIHLNVDYPFHLKGILYFPKNTQSLDPNKSSIHLYKDRVFITSSCDGVVPKHFSLLRGIIDSTDIPLNVSRSALQLDKTVRSLQTHINKKVADRLNALHKQDAEQYQKMYEDLEFFIKFASLHEEKFYERVEKALLWKTSKDAWTTIQDIHEKQGKTLYYQAGAELSPLVESYHKQDVEVLLSQSPLDSHFFTFLERKIEGLEFKRIDSSVDTLVDKEREKTLLNSEGKTEATLISSIIQKHFNQEEVAIEAKSLHDDHTYGFVVIDEGMRRLKESFQISGQKMPSNFGQKETFVVNTNNDLIQSLYKMGNTDEELTKKISHHLYKLSLLSQRELSGEKLKEFVQESSSILTALTNK